MAIRNFREMDVWQLGKKLAIEIYDCTRFFPDAERFGLTSQMRRAAVSIPANIAEGFNRNSRKEFRRYLHIALASCAELDTEAELACELSLFTTDQQAGLLEMINHESRMLRKLIARLGSINRASGNSRHEAPGTRHEP